MFSNEEATEWPLIGSDRGLLFLLTCMGKVCHRLSTWAHQGILAGALINFDVETVPCNLLIEIFV